MDIEPIDSAEHTSAPLLIVGASARAAAMSADRAAIPFVAVDLFADRDLCDLRLAVGVARVAELQELAEVHRQFPPGPWMYTGGLENLPAVVEMISRDRELWGNSADVLSKVRDPQRLQESLSQQGFAVPEIRADERPLAAGTWLWKPYRSAGGRHIRFAEDSQSPNSSDGYLQSWIPGINASGVFVASQQRCCLVGISRQILRRDLGTGGHFPFQYVGSMTGPWDTSEATPWVAREEWYRLGTALWKSFHLTGIFGVDAVIRKSPDGTGELIPIEVNPRYTASVELFERSLGFPAVASHRAACRGDDSLNSRLAEPSRWFGKSILYATDNVVIDASFLARVQRLNDQSHEHPVIADIPHEGARIHSGQPIVTVLATANSREELACTLGWKGSGGLPQQLCAAL